MRAGSANQPASWGAKAPAVAAIAASNIAAGTNGTTIKFAIRATSDSWLKVSIIIGSDISSAERVSSSTMVINFVELLKKRAWMIGAITITPKKARNDKYQLKSPQI